MSVVPVLVMAFGIAKGFGFETLLEEKRVGSLQGQEEVAQQVIGFARSFLENASINQFICKATSSQAFSCFDPSALLRTGPSTMLRTGKLSMNGIIGTDKSGAVRPEPFDFAQDRRVEG